MRGLVGESGMAPLRCQQACSLTRARVKGSTKPPLGGGVMGRRGDLTRSFFPVSLPETVVFRNNCTCAFEKRLAEARGAKKMTWARTEHHLKAANVPRPRWSAPPAPRWYVSNGETVVGPVETELLVRGITTARIPTDCMVIQESSASWRTLSQIRELSGLARSFSWAPAALAMPEVPEDFVSRARDA